MRNKKGSLMSFPIGLISLAIIILVLVALIPVTQNPETRDNVTKVLDSTQISLHDRFNVNNTNGSIQKVVYSFIDFITYSSLEVSKAGVNYGADNPDFVNPRTILTLILIAILIPIFFTAFKFIVVLIILTREWYLLRKEKSNERNFELDDEIEEDLKEKISEPVKKK